MKSLTTLDRLSRAAGWLGKAAILLLLALMLFEVVARYGFSRPTVWGSELATNFNAAVFLLGLAPTLLAGGHISIDVVSARLPARVQAFVQVALFAFLVAPVLAALAAFAWKETARAWASGGIDLAAAWQVPVWPMRLLVAVGLSLFLLQVVASTVRALCEGAARRPPFAGPLAGKGV